MCTIPNEHFDENIASIKLASEINDFIHNGIITPSDVVEMLVSRWSKIKTLAHIVHDAEIKKKAREEEIKQLSELARLKAKYE